MANTCSPLDFVQGMFRVRKRKFTEIYYQSGNRGVNYADLIPASKAYNLTKYKLNIEGEQELQIMAECLSAQLEHERDILTIKFLTDVIGFRLQLEDLTQCEISKIGKFSDTQLEVLYDNHYMPSDADWQLYEKLQKSGSDYIDLEHLDDTIYGKWQWMSILKTYNINKTPEKMFQLIMPNIKFLAEYKHIYAAQQYRVEKYELKSPTDYNAEKYTEVTSNITSLLNKLTADNMLIKADPRFQRHIKDQRDQELLSIVANKFKENPTILSSNLDQFLQNLDRKFDISDKYAIRCVNNRLNAHGYKLARQQNKIDGKIISNYQLVSTQIVQLE